MRPGRSTAGLAEEIGNSISSLILGGRELEPRYRERVRLGAVLGHRPLG